jgi:NitT/TauT family transport system substrate-binding protein
MTNRRAVVKGLGATALTTLAAPSLLRAQELTKISMAFGVKSVNPIMINLVIGTALGYYKEEGLEFTPKPLGSASNAQIALDKGNVQFAVGTPSFQMPLFVKGELPPIV